VELRCQDFVEAIDVWDGPLDVVWIGQSLHHLRAPEKRAFMRKVERLLPPGGLFLIWEPTCFEGEDREGWMERFRQMRPQWPAISDDEFATFDSHHRASDFAETALTWTAMAREEKIDAAFNSMLGNTNSGGAGYLQLTIKAEYERCYGKIEFFGDDEVVERASP
jgi:SAM-dependent methyltransferase